MLGHLWQLLMGLLQQSEQQPPSVLAHFSVCRAPWSLSLTCSGHHLCVPTCKLLAGASQLHPPVTAQTPGTAKKETFSCVYLLRVNVSKKICKIIMDLGTWMHFHKGFRKTLTSRCWVTAVCFVWKFLRNAGRKYLDQVWFSGDWFVCFFQGV